MAAARAEGQVQLVCNGTLLESRGQAQRLRATAQLRTSLNLEAEGSSADAALALLQQRLAAVRSALQALEVRELRVSSPSTWQRSAEAGRPAMVQAALQVSGVVAPSRLQQLIRGVGSLAGVRLAPVGTEADRRDDSRVREALLQEAYRDALLQLQPLAAVLGRRDLQPLEIRIDGLEQPPIALRTVSADATPPFNPAELNQPLQRLSLLARFCAR
ncbi:MAG: SIMPL domain-containing protein [Cyanobium sp.]